MATVKYSAVAFAAGLGLSVGVGVGTAIRKLSAKDKI